MIALRDSDGASLLLLKKKNICWVGSCIETECIYESIFSFREMCMARDNKCFVSKCMRRVQYIEDGIANT